MSEGAGASVAEIDGRPTVALVAHSIGDHGGMERAMSELVKGAWHSYRLVVVAKDLDPSLRPMVARWVRVPVPGRPAPLRFALFYLVAGARLRRLQLDLAHTLGAIVPNRIDLASVHSCHAASRRATGALAPKEAPRLRRFNTTLLHAMGLVAERWTYRRGRTRAIAVVSEGVRREVERQFPGVPVSITPNGVDSERFRPSQWVREQLRREHLVGDDDLVVLFVGGLWVHKGLHLLDMAVAAAQAAVPMRLYLWVLGEGDPRSLPKRPATSQATFFGRRGDTQRFYAAADIFALPSMYEAAPLVAYEAAASGLPVVVTRVGGVTELVGDDACGILVERTVDSVAQALVHLATDAPLRERMGSEARRRAGGYGWDRSVSSVTDLYRALTSTPSEPDASPRLTERNS